LRQVLSRGDPGADDVVVDGALDHAQGTLELQGCSGDVFAGTMDPGSPVHVGVLRVLPTAANGSRRPGLTFGVRGTLAPRPISIDVLRIEGGLVTEITAFASPLFRRFGLPPPLT
jgi:hypothetical protein